MASAPAAHASSSSASWAPAPGAGPPAPGAAPPASPMVLLDRAAPEAAAGSAPTGLPYEYSGSIFYTNIVPEEERPRVWFAPDSIVSHLAYQHHIIGGLISAAPTVMADSIEYQCRQVIMLANGGNVDIDGVMNIMIPLASRAFATQNPTQRADMIADFVEAIWDTGKIPTYYAAEELDRYIIVSTNSGAVPWFAAAWPNGWIVPKPGVLASSMCGIHLLRCLLRYIAWSPVASAMLQYSGFAGETVRVSCSPGPQRGAPGPQRGAPGPKQELYQFTLSAFGHPLLPKTQRYCSLDWCGVDAAFGSCGSFFTYAAAGRVRPGDVVLMTPPIPSLYGIAMLAAFGVVSKTPSVTIVFRVVTPDRHWAQKSHWYRMVKPRITAESASNIYNAANAAALFMAEIVLKSAA